MYRSYAPFVETCSKSPFQQEITPTIVHYIYLNNSFASYLGHSHGDQYEFRATTLQPTYDEQETCSQPSCGKQVQIVLYIKELDLHITWM